MAALLCPPCLPVWRAELRLIFAHRRFVQTKLKILSLQWQRKWLKPSPWHLQPNVLSAVYASEVQPVICQVFFIFFIKSQLLLAFYIAVCLWKEVQAGEHEWSSSDLKQPFSSTFYWREETFLKIIYHLSHAVIHMCVACIPLHGISVLCECWQQQHGTLQQRGVPWQAADKQGGSACQ